MQTPHPLVPPALAASLGIAVADAVAQRAGVAVIPWAVAIALLLGLLGIRLRLRQRPRPAAYAAWAALAALFFGWHAWALTLGPGPALAATLPPQGCAVEATGIVDAEPAPPARFPVRLESLTRGGVTGPVSARVLVHWQGETPRYGDRVSLAGDIHLLEAPRNPGTFDAPRVWQRRGVYAELRVRAPRDAQILEQGHGSPLIARALTLRHWMEKTMALDIEESPQLAGLIQSMVLGVSGESLHETQKLFQYTGTMHLFAVSGMNVAMLAGILQYLLQVAGLRRRAMVCAILPALWAYCYATGLAASSLRATLMATVVYLGVFLDRPALSWNTLAAAALAILAWDSGQLFTPGFQLSFGMVCILLAFARPLQNALRPLTDPDPFLPRPLWPHWLLWNCKARRMVAGAAAVSTIAWIGSMPLTLYYFHLWSPSTIPANLFAAIPAWLMMVLGMASVLAGIVCTPLSALFNNANWLVAKIFLAGISWMAALPGAHEYRELPSTQAAPLCEVVALDIPGGAALHVRAENGGRRADWLVDCGSANAFTYSVCPYLRSRGVTRLDGIVLTHGDAKHIGGALEALRELAPREIIDSPLRDRSPSRKALHQAIQDAGLGKTLVMRGDVLTLAPGVRIHVLFPPAGHTANRADDKALVLRIDAGAARFLLSSDAGFPTEAWLLEHGAPGELRCDAWIKQRHANDLSGTPDFLGAVRPALVIASGAESPAQAEDDRAWDEQVRSRGARVLRQSASGAVRIAIDAQGRWNAEPFLSGQAEK